MLEQYDLDKYAPDSKEDFNSICISQSSGPS